MTKITNDAGTKSNERRARGDNKDDAKRSVFKPVSDHPCLVQRGRCHEGRRCPYLEIIPTVCWVLLKYGACAGAKSGTCRWDHPRHPLSRRKKEEKPSAVPMVYLSRAKVAPFGAKARSRSPACSISSSCSSTTSSSLGLLHNRSSDQLMSSFMESDWSSELAKEELSDLSGPPFNWWDHVACEFKNGRPEWARCEA
eukprot:Sspe_Gene.36085::Locus_17461_Transcript_1_2_Confidence_0.571_Length_834::g.36085::m.36085